ncbi:MAG: winged helix-turn-helix domain-containing protein [Desulfocucumaceae bacterium]
MLESLLGSKNRERVLVFLFCRREGYAREIARFYRTDLDPIQKQLSRLEYGGVLASRKAGRTILYQLNPRYVFSPELTALLKRSLEFLDKPERELLSPARTRPRRKGKPQ